MVYDRQIYKQQQANTAIEGVRERRYFEGVKNVKGEEGELWGLANLFKLTAETVATRDIVNAQRQKELSYRIETFDAAQAGEWVQLLAMHAVMCLNGPTSVVQCVSVQFMLITCAVICSSHN